MKTRAPLLRGGVVALGLASAVVGASASTPPPAPAFKSLRYEEDFRAWRDPTLRPEPLDALKFIPISATGDNYVTLGGDARWRYEYFDHAQWGQGSQDANGFWLQRLMLHADTHGSDRLRLFVQLKSGLEEGREGGPRATDEDRLDLHQAFLDVRRDTAGGGTWTLRAGRQELAFGSSRLISFREGPNVRLAFDGVRGSWRHGDWTIDALAAAPVQTLTGVFDDSTNSEQRLWGVYAVGVLPALPGAHLDLYYLGLRRDSARFDQGTAREKRHSFGLRLWGQHRHWDYNTELVGQTGRFGDAAIAAWTLANDVGFTWATAPLSPRFGLKANIASGDRNPQSGRLQTFNALFPRGAYFNESGLIGPANFMDLHPSVTLKLASTVTLSADVDFFWRESRRDGLYGPAVNLVRSGRTSDARTLGRQVSLLGVWRPGRHWNLTFGYAHFSAGAFIRESGPAEDVNYVTIWIAYTF